MSEAKGKAGLTTGGLKAAVHRRAAGWIAGFRLFNFRGWALAVGSAALVFVIIGIPTDMIRNPFFMRMVPVRTQDYFIWIITAILMGLIAGSFTVGRVSQGAGRTGFGGVLSFLATGCPVCNKIVVLLLGVSGALTYFAPFQIYIGIASIALLLWTLDFRMSAISRGTCAISIPD